MRELSSNILNYLDILNLCGSQEGFRDRGFSSGVCAAVFVEKSFFSGGRVNQVADCWIYVV